MALNIQAARAGTHGFPRPRGDGPKIEAGHSSVFVVSPPTRGWPRGLDAGAGGVGGFPAHAGMAR